MVIRACRRPIMRLKQTLLVTLVSLFCLAVMFQIRTSLRMHAVGRHMKVGRQVKASRVATQAPPGLGKDASSRREEEEFVWGAADKFIVYDAGGNNVDLSFLDDVSKAWSVLAVNLKTEEDLVTCERCRLLENSWVEANVVAFLPEASRQHMPLQTISKMAAYLYVLSQGAQWIYTTNTPQPPSHETMAKIARHEKRTAPVYQGPHDVFEPCAHFMDPSTWFGARGFKTWDVANQGRYNIRNVSTHSVHSILGDCYVLGMDEHNWEHAFDHQAPPAYVMPGTLTTIDFRNILVSKESAWTLVASLEIPENKHTPDSALSPVLLNFMVQRIMWETKQNIGFYSRKPTGHDECSTCAVKDVVYSIGPTFRKELVNWRCNASVQSVLGCLQDLSATIKYNSATRPELHLLVTTWIGLFKVNVTPIRVPMSNRTLSEKEAGIPLLFTPANAMSKRKKLPCPFTTICTTPQKPYIPQFPVRHPIDDITLVVVFNYAAVSRRFVPHLDYIYGRHFKHILFCLDDMKGFLKNYTTSSGNANAVSVVEVPLTRGLLGENCMAAAAKMNYNVRGHLQMGDDMILNVWNLYRLPKQQPWFQKSLKVADIARRDLPDVYTNTFWAPWRNIYSGKNAAVKVYNYLETHRTDPQNGEMIGKFLDNLRNITNCKTNAKCLLYECSDIFYLPKHLEKQFIFFSDIFGRHLVHLEVAIPSILAGLTSDSDLFRLNGEYLWAKDRTKYAYFYNEYNTFQHPWKFSSAFSEAKATAFYCDEFLARLDKDVIAKGGGHIK